MLCSQALLQRAPAATATAAGKRIYRETTRDHCPRERERPERRLHRLLLRRPQAERQCCRRRRRRFYATQIRASGFRCSRRRRRRSCRHMACVCRRRAVRVRAVRRVLLAAGPRVRLGHAAAADGGGERRVQAGPGAGAAAAAALDAGAAGAAEAREEAAERVHDLHARAATDSDAREQPEGVGRHQPAARYVHVQSTRPSFMP